MRRECWWCGMVPGEADERGLVRKHPHTWWRREVDSLVVDICGPCWAQGDLQRELATRREAMVGSLI